MGNYITNKSNTIGINCLICVSMVTLALDLGINTSFTELTCSSLRPLQNPRHTSTSGLSHHKHVALRPSFCVATNANGDSAKYSIKRLRIHIKHNHQKSHFQNETYSGKKKHMVLPSDETKHMYDACTLYFALKDSCMLNACA